MDTGKRLRELREARGLSQEEVAKAIGVGRVTKKDLTYMKSTF